MGLLCSKDFARGVLLAAGLTLAGCAGADASSSAESDQNALVQGGPSASGGFILPRPDNKTCDPSTLTPRLVDVGGGDYKIVYDVDLVAGKAPQGQFPPAPTPPAEVASTIKCALSARLPKDLADQGASFEAVTASSSGDNPLQRYVSGSFCAELVSPPATTGNRLCSPLTNINGLSAKVALGNAPFGPNDELRISLEQTTIWHSVHSIEILLHKRD